MQGNTCTTNSQSWLNSSREYLLKVFKKSNHANYIPQSCTETEIYSLSSWLITKSAYQSGFIFLYPNTQQVLFPQNIFLNFLFFFSKGQVKSLPLEYQVFKRMLQGWSPFHCGISSTNPWVEWDPGREKTDQLFELQLILGLPSKYS